MHRFLIITLLTLVATGCATHRASAPTTTPMPDTIVASGPIALSATGPTTATLAPAEPGAEISDDPILRAITSLVTPQDVETSLRINVSWGDRAMLQCTNFLQLPTTQQRAAMLMHFKELLQIAPIKPVGPLSVLAEKRRVEHDVLSGELATRIAATRAKLDDLQRDVNLACAPLFADERLTLLKLASALGAGKVLP